MKLLAVETATDACSAALTINGVIHERYALASKEHTQLILPMVDELMKAAGLQPSDLDGLAFGCGPGSFTGVRIATGIMQGMALGLDLQVMPVSTLAAIAQDYFDQHDATVAYVAMDARMGEIFWGVYQRDADGFAQLLGSEVVTPPELIEYPDLPGVGLGTGWGVYAQVLLEQLSEQISHYEIDPLPRARAIASLGMRGFARQQAVSVERAMPVYLRNKVAKKEVERC
ncbi:tRNA (adenosine(37)-N6)-threonylcarbamoyltransferase complex dimerization subunit type 1 TsaB [Methylovulum psychrotolerans]|uniref:tRNA threonylcarbamoyladenosine biosynthesis protein TsaB n=1 Tax=Methylovulum psychrotolerans TaxID=1704499 RepID=A0A1Z4BVN5_9GAMM|nr:tRNA (adenosine(37)-N6)-threonylcarbamoyltransferase complex dimerization subunit type 1 TsaB [Methylovulum psychrotolerans]ASF45310.1 tRNA (adenosine(37)-N6)-threonylcarbamoyltransferase complex dimerization subunit type 1 TsaB [Methylovulum psychrotolerans]MBT9096581.1 tRNA (adenosine(37)-N6)-threonylcarbamoyltransferase complex dimerization subunit type 1 TsaB [Methylovulum psychrotolerans]POZ49770.1 tRNA (adenosine(37)-N6)-threonylcarbamoyltransferase complex dimerization subunit type 1 T